MRVYLSDNDERKFIQCDDEGFVASFVYGEWFDRKMVDISKLRELDMEEEVYEIASIYRQAKKALRMC